MTYKTNTYNKNKYKPRCQCGGYFVNGRCVDCDRYEPESNMPSDSIGLTGMCNCGNLGVKHGDEGFLCLNCATAPIHSGVKVKRSEPRFSSREEAMYYKAKYLYLDNPRYLGKEVNEQVVAIAYDRYMSKRFNRFINPELWIDLPDDVR
jgi:hypothetical protein